MKRVAEQPGHGVESIRLWVRQADIDNGHEPGGSTGEAARVRELEQKVRGRRRANEITGKQVTDLSDDRPQTVPGTRSGRPTRCMPVNTSTQA